MSRPGPTEGALPPASLEELRSLVVRIGRDEGGISLGKRAYALLGQLVNQPEQAAVRSISELAELAGVNASTLTRLAKRLGYNGFSHFQEVFRRAIAQEEGYFYSRQAGRLLAALPTATEPVGTIAQVARETAANVEVALAQLRPETVEGFTRLLARAPRVRVHGVRQFHSLASFLTYALGMLRDNVVLLGEPHQGVAESLSQLEGGDVLVVASCSPYTRSVAEIARVASERGLQVLALTDTPASPLAAAATHAIFVPHSSSFYSNSTNAYFVICEGLLTLVAKSLGGQALRALEARERLIADLQVETPV